MLHISLALLALSAFAHAQPLPTCYNVAQTPEFNNSLTGMLNHRLETAVFGITNSACNALCASQPAVWNVQYSAEIQYGGQNECVCFGNLTTPLGDIPTTGTCGPCRDPPGATENCGTANAMNGFITGAPLQVVAVVQPETTCVGFGSVNGSWFGPVGVDPSWAGRLEIHTQDVFHSDARSCNALCTSNGNASYSSMVQIGGQLGCVCVKVTEEERATMVSSQGCSACQVFPPRTPMPDLGTCGDENASNGVIGALALAPVGAASTTTPGPEPTTSIVQQTTGIAATATSTGSAAATSTVVSSTAIASSPAPSATATATSTSKPNGAVSNTAIGGLIPLVFAAAALFV